jgi:hypothetical protein
MQLSFFVDITLPQFHQGWRLTDVCQVLLKCVEFNMVYSIYYENECASSSVSDVDRYVIIINFLYSLPAHYCYSYADGNFERIRTGLTFRKVSCVTCDERYTFFLIRLVGGGVLLGPLGTAATVWPIVAYPG